MHEMHDRPVPVNYHRHGFAYSDAGKDAIFIVPPFRSFTVQQGEKAGDRGRRRLIFGGSGSRVREHKYRPDRQ